MQEVDRHAVDLGTELRDGVEPPFDRTPDGRHGLPPGSVQFVRNGVQQHGLLRREAAQPRLGGMLRADCGIVGVVYSRGRQKELHASRVGEVQDRPR